MHAQKIRKGIKKFLRTFGFHVEPDAEVAFDVVCGMELPAPEVKYVSTHEGTAYYFCSRSCKEHFDGDPGKYVA